MREKRWDFKFGSIKDQFVLLYIYLTDVDEGHRVLSSSSSTSSFYFSTNFLIFGLNIFRYSLFCLFWLLWWKKRLGSSSAVCLFACLYIYNCVVVVSRYKLPFIFSIRFGGWEKPFKLRFTGRPMWKARSESVWLWWIV